MNCNQCGKWAGFHATLPGQPTDHLCMCPSKPAREWVGLTEQEIDLLEELYAPPVHPDFVNDADHCLELIRHVEAKLREKNA